MGKTSSERADSARDRLALAGRLWGWAPHARQRDFFASAAQIRAAACGRRWGKTEALSLDIATLALAEARAGRDCRQLVVAPTDAQARLLGAETLRRLEEAFHAAAPDTDGLHLTTRRHPALQATVHPVGTDPAASDGKKAGGPGQGVAQIWFRTAGRDGRGLRGLWAHRIVADEAAFLPDRVLTEVLLPMLTDIGGDLVLASSPAGRRSAFYRTFARGLPAPNSFGPIADAHGLTYESFQCPSWDNPHLDRAFLQAMAEELGELSYAAEYGAQFVDDYGAVFRADDIAACLRDDPRVWRESGDLVSDPAPGHWYSMGVDWGRRQDYTVVAVLDVTARPARLVRLARWQGMGWEAQAARVGELAARFRPLKVVADGSGVGDPLAERLQAEIAARLPDGDRIPQVTRFVFAGEAKTRLIDGLTLALSARALCFPNHRALVSELKAFEYGGLTSLGRPRMAAAGSGHDDTVIALALAWSAAPAGPPPSPAEVLLMGSSLGMGQRESAP